MRRFRFCRHLPRSRGATGAASDWTDDKLLNLWSALESVTPAKAGVQSYSTCRVGLSSDPPSSHYPKVLAGSRTYPPYKSEKDRQGGSDRLFRRLAFRGPAWAGTRNPTILLALILALALTQLLYATPAVGALAGTVADADGIPISHATVRITGSGFICETDDGGKFTLTNLPVGLVGILITSVGYDSLTIADVRLAEDAPTSISVHLNRRVVPLDGIVVTDSALHSLPQPDIVITRKDIEQSHARTVADALEQKSGIQVEKQSGTVSIRGSSPEHVVILVDGQRVAPAFSGVSTLTGILIENIERIEVHKGGASAIAGPDAIGGVISITSRNPRKGGLTHASGSAASRMGSYDLTRWNANFTAPNVTRSLAFSADVAQEGYQGNFPFRYSAPGRSTVFEGDRINNRTHSETWHSAVNWQAGKKMNVRLNGQVYDGRNGLPNWASRQDSSGFRTDHRFTLNAELLRSISKVGTVTARSGWISQTQYFNDTGDPIAANRYESRFEDKTASVSAEIVNGVWRYTEMRLGAEERYSRINHTDLIRPVASSGKSLRWQTGVWYSIGQRLNLNGLHPLEAVTVSTAWRYDRVTTSHDSPSTADTLPDQQGSALSPLYSVAMTTSGKPHLTFLASYGKSLRIPSVNALFWKGDVRSRGNPYLKPERAEHSEAAITGKYEWRRHAIEIESGYSHSHVSSAIVWQPGQGEVWRPENIGSSLTISHEESVTMSLFDEALTLGYRNAVMAARNKTEGANSYNKHLTYSPEYMTSFSARLSWHWIWIDWRTRLVGRRWANVANTAFYPEYRVDDAGLGISLDITPELKASADLRVDNLFDEDFVVVTHYPMPGKQSSISLTLTYGAM